MIIEEDNHLKHYGILRRSGRYPWGSGGNTASRSAHFLDYVSEMRGQGLSSTDIAKGVGMTTTQLRQATTIARHEKKAADIAMAQRLKEKGYSTSALARRMGVPEATARSLLKPGETDKIDVLKQTSNMLRKEVADKKYIDVGAEVERHLGVSKEKLQTAVGLLKDEGYGIHYVKVPQVGTGQETSVKVLAAPGIKYSEVYRNRDNIQQIISFSQDGGRSYFVPKPPLSVNAKRVEVVYKEDGGDKADGVIYVRPGVNDISLGGSRYAQVRIAVNGTHYLKGMAMYKDDLPDGVDLQFHTNKNRSANKLDAMKPNESDDPINPFGASIRKQILDAKGEKPTSAMNMIYDQGDWDNWSRRLSAQTLSKQSPTLAKSQLQMTHDRKKSELNEIMSLTNPTVRKKLLEEFADSADSSAVHLDAHRMPRSSWHALLPFNSIKETEIYAPNFRPGERVALIRYPHGGTFEIPELTVNNNHRGAKSAIGRAPDAVGINSKVAQRLSGADFDGDAVLVIPNNSGRIKTRSPLEGLKNFDPVKSYPAYEGMPKIKPSTKQNEMGRITNLIADMTIRGAGPDDIAAAVRHSMVVIDAEKHNLNYRQSERDNGIAKLKTKYQGSAKSGASTLITRAGSKIPIPERKPRLASKGGPINKRTGERVYEPTGRLVPDRKTGQLVPKMVRTKQLEVTTDARKLSSGTAIEKVYADHSNSLRALANTARLEASRTKGIPYSPSAAKVYTAEVSRLKAALNIALKNAPLERQAQIFANAEIRAKRLANPDMDPAERKKVGNAALAKARVRTGAGKTRIVISQREWDAIQAGAISTSMLDRILRNSNAEQVRTLATPRTPKLMSSTKVSRAKTMAAQGYTQAEIADALGVSLTTLKEGLG